MLVANVELRISGPAVTHGRPAPLSGPSDPQARYAIYVEGALHIGLKAGTPLDVAVAEANRVRLDPPHL